MFLKFQWRRLQYCRLLHFDNLWEIPRARDANQPKVPGQTPEVEELFSAQLIFSLVNKLGEAEYT